jgi:hypothetical protein
LSNLHPEHSSRGEVALARTETATWHDPEWQRLWLAVESKEWRSLALVPAGEGASPSFALQIAITLSRTGMVHLGTPVQVADGTRVGLNQLNAFIGEVRRCTSNGDRLLVALPPLGTSPITAAIAQSADAAVLCVLLGSMSSSAAKRTLKAVGASRFLGSAIFHQDGKPAR